MSDIVRNNGSRPPVSRRSTRGGCNGLRYALAVLVLAMATMATMAAQAADDELHDPFMPPGWNEPSAPAAQAFNASAWTLESTLTSNGRRVAIINGRAVRPGERIGGARLLGVTRGSARLDYNGHRFTIRRPATQVRTSRESAQ